MRGCSPKSTTRAANWRRAHSTVQQQADKLQEQTDQLMDWNKSLEERVEKQLGEIERIRRLERFLAPQVAQLIASSDGHDGLLDSHRREVTVVFCDLRGFTAFTESTEPEEAMNVLREYHAALGELIFRYEGTLDRYAGDGVMILFNAPIQFADHAKRAVKMAVEMRDTIGALTENGATAAIASASASASRSAMRRWARSASSSGWNTPRSAASPTSPRGCATKPRPTRSWSAARVFGMVEQWVEGRPIDDLVLKGFNHPVLAVEILRWREEGEAAETVAAPAAVVAVATPAAPRRKKQPS